MNKMEKKKLSEPSNNAIWDCGSSLYDSFELKSFQKQLHSALASRTLSMPHLSNRRYPPPPPVNKKQASKISRSFQRLIRAVFKPKSRSTRAVTSNNSSYEESKQGFYVVYDDRAPTIPEVSEFDDLSPEIRSILKRSASARFTSAASVGITCS